MRREHGDEAALEALRQEGDEPRSDDDAAWGDELAASEPPPILVVNAHDDPYTGGPELTRSAAARFAASVAELDGLGHWWMMQDPARSAAMLRSFLD